MSAETRIARWIESVVIGLDLCPFAASVWKSGRVRIEISDAADQGTAVQALLQEALRLLESDDISTTLVVYPHALADFDAFLDAVAAAEAALAEAGAEGILQIATFHPDYRFEGVPPGARGNYTNRAPHPVMQLLRESEVSDAVDRHPDPEGIPSRNIERLESMEEDAIDELFSG